MKNAQPTAKVFAVIALLCGLATAIHGETKHDDSFAGQPRLILPPVVYATPGVECNIYFDNVILTLNSNNFAFNVTCSKGLQLHERWTFTPQLQDVGELPIVIEVRDENNTLVARGQSIVRVAGDAQSLKETTLLIVGDSLTEATTYPQEILDLSTVAGKAWLKMIGSRGAKNMPPTGALRHEGYSGWTAEAFATLRGAESRSGRYERGVTGSPFIYDDSEGKKTFDFARYCTDFNGGKGPDLITIGLGTNDIFSANDDTIDQTIDRMLSHYDALIDAMHKVRVDSFLGVQLPIPPATSQDGFRNYVGAGKQTRWQYRRNQHRLIERLIEHYGKHEGDHLYLIPVYLNIDAEHGFPTWSPPINSHLDQKITRVNNGIHPNESGYKQMGDEIFSWIATMRMASNDSVGSSRVDLQACKLEYSIVSPK